MIESTFHCIYKYNFLAIKSSTSYYEDIIMGNQQKPPTGENKKGSRVALEVLDALLRDSVQKKISNQQALVILDALAGADDPALVARFPAVLAICARKGIELSSQDLFARYWELSPKRQNLEKLLLISAWLFKRENIEAPRYIDKITESFKRKYRDLFTGEICQLSNGIKISTRDMHATLKAITSDYQFKSTPKVQNRQPESAQLHAYLDRLFSPKQKDLVFKKLNKQTFTKTEREYYSRVVRKKLEAIANEKIRDIAATLTAK